MKAQVGHGLFLLVMAAVGVGVASPLDGIVRSPDGTPPAGYVPPMIGNGEINMTIDYTAGMRTGPYYQLSSGIFKAGRRVSHPKRELPSHGWLNAVLVVDGVEADLPDSWEQTLDIVRAETRISGSYPGGITMRTELFVPLAANLICIRRTVANVSSVPHTVLTGIDFAGPQHERFVGAWQGAEYSYRFYGYNVITGSVRLASAGEADLSVRPNGVRRLSKSCRLNPGEERTSDFFVAFVDSFDASGTGMPVCDYQDLRTAHRADWASYYGESYIRLPDAKLQRLVEMAQYHLRCNATRWGFPVGIFDSHWQGLYFGFDEMYMHQGLLASGHFDIARREPDYRNATRHLAEMRVSHYWNPTVYGARWFWESVEDGASEGTIPGFWMDHVFHAPAIAKCAWTQYLFVRDVDYLRDVAYPIILDCVRFLRTHCVYEDGEGASFVGKCTDLERLGPARERPFMTTCGAVYAFRAAAEASEILKTNLVEAAEFRQAAGRLLIGLPQEDGRYLACANDPQDSVGTLAGFYPFPIFTKEDAAAVRTARYFVEKGRAGGNMYPKGNRVCPWYAAWMSAAFTELEDRVEPCRWLSEAASASGLFGEIFEINEPDMRYHPWFATAAGNCLTAVCRMLVCDVPEGTRIAWTVPSAWKDFSFRLPCARGATVDCEVRNGKIVRLNALPRSGEDVASVKFLVRGQLNSAEADSRGFCGRK